MKKINSALILGMFETGLGVARSLGFEGIKVFGMDFKKDIAFYSRYVQATLCPHPLENQEEFLCHLKEWAAKQAEKPVLFISADIFLLTVSQNRYKLSDHFLFNLPARETIESIADKYRQHQLAQSVKVDTPLTYCLDSIAAAEKAAPVLPYPVFIKALDVNTWKKAISGTMKGFVIKNRSELLGHLSELSAKKVAAIVQEIIPGPDTNHYKFCGYADRDGRLLLGFTLRKIRQNPVHFGVGAVVESIDYPELHEIGSKFFKAIDYRGVGSAEFKYDERDNKLKLIELNPRYWQQNSLGTACGMNFPLVDYLEVTGQNPGPRLEHRTGIKWVNRYMDLDSFLKYRKEKVLTFRAWRKSLKGKKIYSDFSWRDPIPAFYEIGFGLKLLKAPWYFFKRLANEK